MEVKKVSNLRNKLLTLTLVKLKYNIRHLRNAMALVGQEPTLFNLSIRENIAYGISDVTTQQQIESAAKLANIHAFIESLPDVC